MTPKLLRLVAIYATIVVVVYLLLVAATWVRAAVNPWGNYVCWNDVPNATGYRLLSATYGVEWQERADSVDRGQPFPECIDYYEQHCCLLPADALPPGTVQFFLPTAYNSWGESLTEHGSFPGDLP